MGKAELNYPIYLPLPVLTLIADLQDGAQNGDSLSVNNFRRFYHKNLKLAPPDWAPRCGSERRQPIIEPIRFGLSLLYYMYAAHPWFALQTRPKNERKVERLLKQKGYDCFTPIYRSKRKWSDRTIELDFPLFPGYVFCRFNPSALGRAIATQGVTRVVGFGGAPAEVAREEVDALQILARSSFLREPWKYLPDGTLVLVETGPLAGIQGVISADENKRHLIISVTLLQQSVAIRLGEDTVVSVIEDPKGSKVRFTSESHLAMKLLRKT